MRMAGDHGTRMRFATKYLRRLDLERRSPKVPPPILKGSESLFVPRLPAPFPRCGSGFEILSGHAKPVNLHFVLARVVARQFFAVSTLSGKLVIQATFLMVWSSIRCSTPSSSTSNNRSARRQRSTQDHLVATTIAGIARN